MQARRSILVFTILLTLACLYQISFSYFTNKAENKALARAAQQLDSISKGSKVYYVGEKVLHTDNEVEKEDIKNLLEDENIRRIAYKPIYPITGKTYSECKANEMALGLDLKGGMAVTVEVSYADLVLNLAGKTKNDVFQKPYQSALKISQQGSTDDFITIFEREFNKLSAGKSMASIFALGDPNKFNTKMTNGEVIKRLRSEATDALDRTEYIISGRINQFGVTEPNIQKQPLTGRLLIELPGVKDKARVRKQIQSTANLEFWETYDNPETEKYLNDANKVLALELYNLEDTDPKKDTKNEKDTSGTDPKDTTLAANGVKDSLNKDTSLAAGSTSAADSAAASEEEQRQRNPIFQYLQPAIYPIKDMPGKFQWEQGCRIGVCALKDTAKLNKLLKHPALANVFPQEMRFLWAAKPGENELANTLSLYVIKVTSRDGSPALEGRYVVDARQEYDQVNSSRVVVNMQMDNEGAAIWANLTKNNKPSNGLKHAIAIVLDGLVYSAPTVEGEIPNGSSVIQGNFTVEEASDLSKLLKIGSLPAPARIVDEAIVGPTLGAENISRGLLSFLASFVLILIYMIIFYNTAGIVANVALLTNVFFLMGSLASIQATLTLPGIAGIVLTLGTAVDGNVLIYERIKEMLREGKSLKQAIEDGFKGSYATILDANVTNLLIAIVLLVFGTGPIRGFAVTLIIGIFTSVFTSVFITRLVVSWFMERKKTMKFSFKWSEKFLATTNFDFVKRRKIYYTISAVFIIGGFISLGYRGLDYGVEFTGGRSYVVQFEKAADYDAIANSLEEQFIEQDGSKLRPEVKMIENKFTAKITTKYLINEGYSRETDSIVDAKLDKGLSAFGKYQRKESRKIDPVISAAFKKSAIISILLSVIIMFLYIMIRFQRWQYGMATAVALLHDVLFVLGMYSMLHGIMPFSLEIDQAFIASILTIMGYSINDTVVVFDRIREYLRSGRKDSQEVLINEALNSTLSRTVNNSLTIAIVLFAIFFFGPESIQGFVFAMMVGVVIGTYSSVCVATPILVDMAGRKKASATAQQPAVVKK